MPRLGERAPNLYRRPARRKASKPKLSVALIDRDGTLIHEPQDDFQIDSVEKLKILPGVYAGLKLLRQNRYGLWLVSNQDGVGTESFPSPDFYRTHYVFRDRLKRQGLEFDEEFICPHMPAVGCDCRKPKTGLYEARLERAELDERSFVMGDRASDEGLADNLGIAYVKMELNGNFYNSLTRSEIGKLLVREVVDTSTALLA